MRRRVVDAGPLHLPSGHLEFIDPLVQAGNGTVPDVDPCDYDVQVTVADVSADLDGTHQWVAFVSVILAHGQPASLEPARASSGAPHADGLVSFPSMRELSEL